MANLTIENFDNAGVTIGNELYEDGLLNFAGSDDYAAGTILGKIKIAAGTAAAGTNTGNGTVSAFALVTAKELSKIGNYTFVLTAALVGDLKDPDGNIILKGVALTDGAATVISANGITFTITDGATPFAAGDSFTLPVATGSGKYVEYATDGIGGAQFPASVLVYAASKSSSGDIAIRALVRGDVRKEKLVIDSGATVGDFEIAELKKNSIFAISVDEQNGQDNQ